MKKVLLASLILIFIITGFLACGGKDAKADADKGDEGADKAKTEKAEPMPEGDYTVYKKKLGDEKYKYIMVYDNMGFVFMAGTQTSDELGATHMSAYGGFYEKGADGTITITIKYRAMIMGMEPGIRLGEWKDLKPGKKDYKVLFKGKMEEKKGNWVLSGIAKDGKYAFGDGEEVDDGTYEKVGRNK